MMCEQKYLRCSQVLGMSVLCQLLISCVAFQLPSESHETTKFVPIVKALALKVAVMEYKFPVYSHQLTRRLQKTNLFNTADHISSFDNSYDVYVELNDHEYDDDLSVGTLIVHVFGLLPYTDKHWVTGDDFVMYSSAKRHKISCFDFSLDRKAIMWLGAPFIALHPDWSLFEPEYSDRYITNMRKEISVEIHRFYSCQDESNSSGI